jgi:hypothetical protein
MADVREKYLRAIFEIFPQKRPGFDSQLELSMISRFERRVTRMICELEPEDFVLPEFRTIWKIATVSDIEGVSRLF